MPSPAAPARRALAAWPAATSLCAVLVVLSIAIVDRPVAIYAAGHPGPAGLYHAFIHIPEVLGALCILVLLILGPARASGAALGPRVTVVWSAAVAFAVSYTIKDAMKFVFGRTWPGPWIHDWAGWNPSLLGDGTYGFFPLHGGEGWRAFPSGHTTATASIAAVLWCLWPRYRVLWAALPVLVGAGLILTEEHFAADVIAGGFVGAAVGLCVARGVSAHRPSVPKAAAACQPAMPSPAADDAAA